MPKLILNLPNPLISDMVCPYLSVAEIVSLRLSNKYLSSHSQFPIDVSLTIRARIIDNRLSILIPKLEAVRSVHQDKQRQLKQIEDRESGSFIARVSSALSSILPSSPPPEEKSRLINELHTLSATIKKAERLERKLELKLDQLCRELQRIRREAKIKTDNHEIFERFKKLNLPIGKYAIVGHGPLGIRNLKKIEVIVIFVSLTFQKVLAKKHPIQEHFNMKYLLLDKNIEAYWEGSNYTQQIASENPRGISLNSIIAKAEIIEGLAFQSLEHTLYFKKKNESPEDLKEIDLIDQWQQSQPT